MDRKAKIIKIIAVILVVVIIPLFGTLAYMFTEEEGSVAAFNWTDLDSFYLSDITTFEMNDNQFKILQLTDPQFNFPLKVCRKSTAMITKLIEDNNPDLIIITGDICGIPINGIIYEQFLEFMDSFKTPYAIVFGNHDAEGRATKSKLSNLMEDAEYSVFSSGPANLSGLGNYVINVNNGDKVAWSLFMLDSNQYTRRFPTKIYDYIQPEQIEWYAWNVENMKVLNGGSLNSLAFFHIPLPEFIDAWKLKDTDQVVYHFGDKREDQCSPEYNSGFFDKMIELGSTKGVFAGHDHVNDYSVTYKGIRLTYGLKSGYGSYKKKGVTGGLVITLSENSFAVEQLFLN